jgi:hypothetical protein
MKLIAKYSSPRIEIYFINVEHGICNSSAKIYIGIEDDAHTPSVDSWINSSLQETRIDL